MRFCEWFYARGMRRPSLPGWGGANDVRLEGFPSPPPSASESTRDEHAHRRKVVMGYIDDLFMQTLIECSRAHAIGAAPREVCAAIAQLSPYRTTPGWWQWTRGCTAVEIAHAEPRQWHSGYAVHALRVRMGDARRVGAVVEVTCTAPTATTRGALRAGIVGANNATPLVLDPWHSESLCSEFLYWIARLHNTEAEYAQLARDYTARRGDV